MQRSQESLKGDHPISTPGGVPKHKLALRKRQTPLPSATIPATAAIQAPPISGRSSMYRSDVLRKRSSKKNYSIEGGGKG